MRSVILRSLAVIGVGGLVLAGVLYVASTVDARPPQVLEIVLTQPLTDDPARALITTSLEVVFSEPVDQESARDALHLDPAVDGAVSWSGSTLIFTPNSPLELETAYAVSIADGVRDLAGNEMTELPPDFEFETTGRPSLVEATPEDGAVDVPLDAPLALTFSTLMDTSSVDAALRLRPSFAHELHWSGERLEIVPDEPLRPGLDYEVSVQGDAVDVAGVALDDPVVLRFRTVEPGLVAEVHIPADGIDGIALTTSIAVIFDRPIDPDSVSDDLLTITPEVGGTLDVVRLPADPATDTGAGSMLRFAPSTDLEPNTTYDVELGSGITSVEGGVLASPRAWSFTTGAPVTTVSNQITFLSDRGGVTNVWSMNPDGSGKRQLSSELVPVLDYAVAPDGSSLVLADGRRLVHQRPDGSERRILTDEENLEFDPTYAPDSRRVAFARADARTGVGLGLWEWVVGGGEAAAIDLPPTLGDGPPPTSDDDDEAPLTLRAPRYSPDGQALAFVHPAGWIGLLELPAQRLTWAAFDAGAAPLWLPDSSSLVLTAGPAPAERPSVPVLEAPISPLGADDPAGVYRLARSGRAVSETAFGDGATTIAVAADGRLAYVDGQGTLRLTDASDTGSGLPVLPGDRVAAGAFAPGEPAMVIVVAESGADGAIELLDIGSGRRTPLAATGSRPRWLP